MSQTDQINKGQLPSSSDPLFFQAQSKSMRIQKPTWRIVEVSLSPFTVHYQFPLAPLLPPAFPPALQMHCCQKTTML